jgi:hypothetical protein
MHASLEWLQDVQQDDGSAMLSAMFSAVKTGDLAELERLIAAGVDVAQPDTAPGVRVHVEQAGCPP